MDLVVGATGQLGSEIARRLRSAGRPVRGLVRTTSAPDVVGALHAADVETVLGDLKDPDSLRAALAGVSTVVTTVTATLSRADGDSLDTVDNRGQVALVAAAQDAGVERFVHVSFPPPSLPSPLSDAKRAVEAALAAGTMPYTVLQPTNFLEVWFSPLMGIDVAAGTARLLGDGEGRVSWVSRRDVAEVAVRVLTSPEAAGQVIPFGGPEPLSQRAVVGLLEQATGTVFAIESVPVDALRQSYATATDPMERTFAALMLATATGDGTVHDNAALLALLPDLRLTSAAEFAKATA